MKTTTVTVTVRWGSDPQKEVAAPALTEMLQAWKKVFEQRHTGNFVKIDVTETDV